MFAIYRFYVKHYSANANLSCFSCLFFCRCIVCLIFVLFCLKGQGLYAPSTAYNANNSILKGLQLMYICTKIQNQTFFLFLIQHPKCLNSSTEMETFSVIERTVSFKVFNARVSLYEIGNKQKCLRHVVNLCSLPPNKFKIQNSQFT